MRKKLIIFGVILLFIVATYHGYLLYGKFTHISLCKNELVKRTNTLPGSKFTLLEYSYDKSYGDKILIGNVILNDGVSNVTEFGLAWTNSEDKSGVNSGLFPRTFTKKELDGNLRNSLHQNIIDRNRYKINLLL